MGFPEWRVAAASVCGVSHTKINRPCQDAYDWVILPGGILVAAVADGAGSATLAELGAGLAARTAIEAICERWDLAPASSGSSAPATPGWMSPGRNPEAGPARMMAHRQGPGAHQSQAVKPLRLPTLVEADWRAVFGSVFASAQKALVSAAVARDVPKQDLATTLSVVVAWPEGVAAAQIGDGTVVVGEQPDAVVALITPARGEYLNETIFLTSEGALEDLPVNVWHGFVAHVAVLSDGLQMLALQMPGGVPHAPFFAPLFRYLATVGEEGRASADLTAFLGSPRIAERTDDDLTLLLAVLRG